MNRRGFFKTLIGAAVVGAAAPKALTYAQAAMPELITMNTLNVVQGQIMDWSYYHGLPEWETDGAIASSYGGQPRG